MKDWGSTAYEGLKTAIQGIYDCSGIFQPLQSAAGVLLTISKVVDVHAPRCGRLKWRTPSCVLCGVTAEAAQSIYRNAVVAD
jgi:hypothetical protein